MNPILQSLENRKSVRAFLPQPIAPRHKQAILQAAAQAPTAGGQQLYTILDITNQALKEKLSHLCDEQPFIAQAPLVLVFLADCHRWQQCYTAAGATPRAAGVGDLLLAVADACVAAQNTVVAAESLGVGSCYIGDVLEHHDQVCACLALPPRVVPIAMLVYGYPTKAAAQRQKPLRFASDYIVSENTYPDFSPQQHKAAFCEREQRKAAQRQALHPEAAAVPFDFAQWVTAFCNRKYQSEFAREMSRSAAQYLADFAAE